MILKQGEKIHVIHRRHFEKEPHRHFLGVVDAYEGGVVRATGNVFTADTVKGVFFRRPERRTRIISLVTGDVLVNVIPDSVDLEAVVYKVEKKSLRVTDGGGWYLDINEVGWR